MAELATSNDPKALVPGNVQQVGELAATMERYGATLISVGEGFKALDDGGWKGPGAEEYRAFAGQQPHRWITCGEAFSDCCAVLYAYADTLAWAQTQAAGAAQLYQEAAAETKAASLSGTAMVGGLPLTLSIPDLGNTLLDPGAKKRAEAHDLLDRARAQLNDVADQAVKKIREAAELAPQKPWWDGIGDAWNGFWGGAGQAVGDGIDGLHTLVASTNDERVRVLAQGAEAVIKDPVGVAKGMVDWDTWATDPARALGLAIPGLVTKRLGPASRPGDIAGRISKQADKIVESTPELRAKASRLSMEQAVHITDGDGPGSGGHRWKNYNNFPEENFKSYFPKEWNDGKILDAIKQVVKDPDSTWVQETGPVGELSTRGGDPAKFKVFGVSDGVAIQVMVEPDGRGVLTGFPPGNTFNTP